MIYVRKKEKFEIKNPSGHLHKPGRKDKLKPKQTERRK
jgi:hypothetical protein